MKKNLALIITVCCIASAFTACSSDSEEASVTSSTTSVTTAANEVATVSDPVTTSASLTTTESEDSSPISSEGILYRDVDGRMCGKLITDDKGKHFSICMSDEYIEEYAASTLNFTDFGEYYVSKANDTKEERNHYLVHGCIECLCLDMLSIDGFMTTQYMLYPIKNIPDADAPKKTLTTFSATLDNHDNKQRFYDDEMPDFFDDNQKKTFANATYLMENICTGINFGGSGNDTVTVDGIQYNSTGMSYASFVEYAESIFTEKYSAEAVAGSNGFINIKGELYTSDGARGGNALYTGRSFKLISKSDNEIKFKLIAHFSYKNTVTEEEYRKMPENEREYDKEFTFTLENRGCWSFSEFNYWM